MCIIGFIGPSTYIYCPIVPYGKDSRKVPLFGMQSYVFFQKFSNVLSDTPYLQQNVCQNNIECKMWNVELGCAVM